MKDRRVESMAREAVADLRRVEMLYIKKIVDANVGCVECNWASRCSMFLSASTSSSNRFLLFLDFLCCSLPLSIILPVSHSLTHSLTLSLPLSSLGLFLSISLSLSLSLSLSVYFSLSVVVFMSSFSSLMTVIILLLKLERLSNV